VGEILLIAADWQLRALVRAQLLEEGYAVRALPSLEIALAHLLRSGGQPRLTIVDTQGLQVEARQLAELRRLTGQTPLILCGGVSGGGALAQEGLSPTEVLLRPFRVGDLVAQVRKVLACPEGDARVT
jgi:DNA-binding response OmpR family regulator